jgi:hypothetical protein
VVLWGSQQTFGRSLPRILKPQPTLIVIDEAEDLIAKHRAAFVGKLEPWVKQALDRPLTLQLVLVTKTDAGTESLEALNGGTLFHQVLCPRPSDNAVVRHFGKYFADPSDMYKRFESRIAVLADYAALARRPSPEDYLGQVSGRFQREKVKVAVSRDELTRWGREVSPTAAAAAEESEKAAADKAAADQAVEQSEKAAADKAANEAAAAVEESEKAAADKAAADQAVEQSEKAAAEKAAAEKAANEAAAAAEESEKAAADKAAAVEKSENAAADKAPAEQSEKAAADKAADQAAAAAAEESTADGAAPAEEGKPAAPR